MTSSWKPELIDPFSGEIHGSEIRITFNRPFTWAERESFRDWLWEQYWYIEHVWNHDGTAVTIVSDEDDTRYVVEEIQNFVGWEFLNIYPRAAKTIFPKVVV